MITVINDRYYDESYNSLYEGMSLPEAAAQMVLECSQAINDLQMDTLLMEHSYLIENGEEIEYVTENDFLDGIKDKASDLYDKGKAHGSVLINKIGMLIDKVATMIRELWEKAVDFVQEKITEFRRKLFTMGHSEKEYKELIKNARSGAFKDLDDPEFTGLIKNRNDEAVGAVGDSQFMTGETIVFVTSQLFVSSPNDAQYKSKKANAKEMSASASIEREFTLRAAPRLSKDSTEVYNELGKLVYTPNVFIKQIRNAQRICDDKLKKMKKIATDSKLEASELANTYKEINECLKHNSNVARAGVKQVNKSTLIAMKGVKAIFTALRKDKRDKDAADAKKKAKKALADLDSKNESYYYSGSNSIYSAYTF
jgi:hypothetical protein